MKRRAFIQNQGRELDIFSPHNIQICNANVVEMNDILFFFLAKEPSNSEMFL